jgi:hypothetical protein
MTPFAARYIRRLPTPAWFPSCLRDNSSGIALGYGLDDQGFESRQGLGFFFPPPRPDRLWGPPSLLSNGYQGFFPWRQSGWGGKLTNHLHLVPRSRLRGAMYPLPQYAFMAWCSVKQKDRDNCTFTFTVRNKHNRCWDPFPATAH